MSKWTTLGKALVADRPDTGGDHWQWLEDGDSVSKRSANKFLFACIIDYQQKWERVWARAKEFIEEELGDPVDLWQVVVDHGEDGWMEKKDAYALHHLSAGHRRLFLIGRGVLGDYRGDARNIWSNAAPCTILERLLKLGVGPQLSRMTIGGLMDSEVIQGVGDVKADTHVTRVLGRLCTGGEVSAEEAIQWARRLHPENPWLLDKTLFHLGQDYCHSRSPPACSSCKYVRRCAFNA